MGMAIGLKVEEGRWKLKDLVNRMALLRSGHAGSFALYKNIKGEKVRRWEGVKVIEAGPKICRKIAIVTGGFGDLDQVMMAGLDTLITGEADYPTEVKARELGINIILGGHRETEVFGVRNLQLELSKIVNGDAEY
jgi:putative NIF3 family GTP cyclohydrolase 1 type 2